MGEIVNLTEHKLLKYHAATQGLSYREYRWMLRECNIPLEEAIENARKGTTINDHLKRRARNNKVAGIGICVLAALSIGLGSYLAYLDRDRPETRINNQETLTEFVMKYGIQ